MANALNEVSGALNVIGNLHTELSKEKEKTAKLTKERKNLKIMNEELLQLSTQVILRDIKGLHRPSYDDKMKKNR